MILSPSAKKRRDVCSDLPSDSHKGVQYVNVRFWLRQRVLLQVLRDRNVEMGAVLSVGVEPAASLGSGLESQQYKVSNRIYPYCNNLYKRIGLNICFEYM